MNDKPDAAEFHKMLLAVAEQIPPQPDVQPENDLHPSPIYLRHRINMLELRINEFEQWAIRMNPTFWQSIIARRKENGN